jgi:hypothetical protein
MNNGYASDWFNLERSVRQGCPLAPFLFVLTVELLAISIRQNKDIKGFVHNGISVKISQLADDTTCFLRDEQSAFNLLKLIDDFSKLSGLKCNLEKTEAIWIGANKGKPPGKLPVKWSGVQFSTLGIVFVSDGIEMAYKFSIKMGKYEKMSEFVENARFNFNWTYFSPKVPSSIAVNLFSNKHLYSSTNN